MTRLYNATIVTPRGTGALKGEQMHNGVVTMSDMEIVIDDSGVITSVAPSGGPSGGDSDIDLEGRVVLPGFVDSHTHLPFGGWRPDEFGWRLRGDSYMSIMERGGGIVNTMKATREASTEALVERTLKQTSLVSAMGVTTIEGKSGYGLDLTTELRQLEVLRQVALSPGCKVGVVSTFLGAHAVPPEWKGDPEGYINYIIDEVLPRVKERGLAEFCDVFCEKGVFDIALSRRLLEAARSMGFKLKLHADEIVSTGGAELAAEVGAVSADHLLHVSDAGIDAMARAGVIATLLPLTAFTLREPYARARDMIDRGCAVALATDFNPGSCCSYSIPLTIALACIYMNMTVEEAVAALTLNAAAALDRADTVGSIEPGKRGDLAILNVTSPQFLPYMTGINLVQTTVRGGVIVSQQTFR